MHYDKFINIIDYIINDNVSIISMKCNKFTNVINHIDNLSIILMNYDKFINIINYIDKI
jgi:hypothetical protein